MGWKEDKFLEELSNDLDAANREVCEHISVVRIPLEELKEHESNFYNVSGIEALAEEISVMGGGLLNPIKVFKNNTIVSGHRRFNAFKLLAETDVRFNTIPAIYVDNFETEEEELLYLMNENNQRVKTKEELTVEIQMKKELYVTLKENGDERYQSVNINKLLAEEFGMSETSIKRATGNAKTTKQEKSNSVLSMERNIQERLSTKAVITGNEKGYLKIRFESVNNLNDLLEQMNLLTDD